MVRVEPTLTVKVIPYEGEALSSFMIRAAHGNGARVEWFMKHYRRSASTFIHLSDISKLDYVPENILNLNLIEKHLSLAKGVLRQMSFINILTQFSGGSKPEDSRVMRGLIRKTLAYCPQCLEERATYPLLWRFQGMDYCQKHRTALMQSCMKCKKQLMYSSIYLVGFCPYCKSRLASQVAEEKIIQEPCINESFGKYKIMEQLLQFNSVIMSSQSLARKIIYVASLNAKVAELLVGDLLGISYENLLQHARGTMSTKRSIHLNVILNFLYHTEISINELSNLEVPVDYKERMSHRNVEPDINLYSCSALWCSSYARTGSLRSTKSGFKYNQNRVLDFYVFCYECGCEYAISEGKLRERSDFIRGYSALADQPIQDLTWREIATYTGFSLAKNKRIRAYFTVRGIGSGCSYIYEQERIDAFLKGIQDGIKIAKIKEWDCWETEEHYFCYRYHIHVMRAILEKVKARHPRKNKIETERLLMSVCEELLDKNQKITNPVLLKAVGVSMQTLAKWGLKEYIDAVKQHQKKLLYEHKIRALKAEIDTFFEDRWHTHMKMNEVYQLLGYSQSQLCGYAPEINTYIRQKRFYN